MTLKKLAVIVIIAHKEFLTENEKLSLAQCYKILYKHPIKLICPAGLDISEYKKINHDLQVEFIDPEWQSSYSSFNLLKMNLLLYKKFRNYKYILFYELDAWVFKDDLEYWCNKAYDYIGAPWFEGWGSSTSINIIGVGNGGFSLRNIESAIRIIKRERALKMVRAFWFKSRLQTFLRFNKLVLIFKNYFHIRNYNELNKLLLSQYYFHEDNYWGNFVNGAFDDYKVASIEDAIKFSFEVNPGFLYEMNSMQLPFGCHAWEKHDPEFWKPFISDNKK